MIVDVIGEMRIVKKAGGRRWWRKLEVASVSSKFLRYGMSLPKIIFSEISEIILWVA